MCTLAEVSDAFLLLVSSSICPCYVAVLHIRFYWIHWMLAISEIHGRVTIQNLVCLFACAACSAGFALLLLVIVFFSHGSSERV